MPTQQPTSCRLAALIGTALIVPLLFLVFASSSNPRGAPSHSRRLLLLNSDVNITDGGQDSGVTDGPANSTTAGIVMNKKADDASSMRGNEQNLFITAAKGVLPPLSHQIQEEPQATDGRASLILPTAEEYDSSLDESNGELLLQQVDALVDDMMYESAEYENEMQLNLDIDLPLLLVMEDRDATADVMEMIEVRATAHLCLTE